MRGGVFARYVLLYQRLTADNLGFVPGLTKAEMGRLVDRMVAWARQAKRAHGLGVGPWNPEDDRAR